MILDELVQFALNSVPLIISISCSITSEYIKNVENTHKSDFAYLLVAPMMKTFFLALMPSISVSSWLMTRSAAPPVTQSTYTYTSSSITCRSVYPKAGKSYSHSQNRQDKHLSVKDLPASVLALFHKAKVRQISSHFHAFLLPWIPIKNNQLK